MKVAALLLVFACFGALAIQPIKVAHQTPLKDEYSFTKHEAENAFANIRVEKSSCELGSSIK